MPGRLVGVRLSPEDEKALQEAKMILRLEGVDVDGDADTLRKVLWDYVKPARPGEMPVFAEFLAEAPSPRRKKRGRRLPGIDEALYGRSSKHGKHLRRRK